MQAKANKSMSAVQSTSRESSTSERSRARSGAANHHRQKQLAVREALNPRGLNNALGFPGQSSGLLLQTKSDSRKSSSSTESPVVPSHVRSVMASPGRPLDRATRNFMEQRFSHDFSRVRVHDDGAATESARTMAARAYTVGQHIAFAPGRYAPHSHAGRRLLAHELTHTIQQRGLQRATGGITMPLATENQRYEQEAHRVSAAIWSGGNLPALTLARRPALQLDGPAYNLRLTYPPNHTESHSALPLVEALHVLKRFGDRVEAHLEGGLAGHRALREIHEDQYVVSRVADLFGGRTFPPLTIWTTPRTYLIQGRAAIGRADVNGATRLLQQAAQASRRAERTVYEYREGTIAGAERAIFGLEVVQVAAATIVTVGTGGTAAGVTGSLLVGAGYAGAQRLAGEASRVHYGLQDRIDWEGVAFDTFFSLVAGRFGGRLGASVTRALAPRLGTRLAGRITTAAVTNLIVGRASGLAHAVAREVFDAARDERELTVDGFINLLAEQLSLRAAFFDLVSTAAGSATSAARPRPPQPPSPTGPALPAARQQPQLRSLQGGDTRPVPTREGRVLSPSRALPARTAEPPTRVAPLVGPTPPRTLPSSPATSSARGPGTATVPTSSPRTTTTMTPPRASAPQASTATAERQGNLALARQPQPIIEPVVRPRPQLVPAPAQEPTSVTAPRASASTATSPSSSVSTAVAINAATGPTSHPGPRRRNKPTGLTTAYDDAIPLVWYKHLSYYESPIILEGNPYEINVQRRLPRGHEIGVHSEYFPEKDKILLLLPEPRRPNVARQFKNTLAEYGFVWGDEYQPDHIQDLEWSGHDGFDNLWPLASGPNQLAGGQQNLRQPLRYYANYNSPTPINLPILQCKQLPASERALYRYFRINQIRRL